MIARSENGFAIYSQTRGQFSKSCSFIVRAMTETGINVVPYNNQIRDRAAIIIQEFVNDIRVAVIARDQTERGVRIFVDAGMKPRGNPIDDVRQVRFDFCEQVSMRACAASIPILDPEIG